MQAVALVAVDTEKEKLRVRQLAAADKKEKKVKGQRVMQRSKSLMNVRWVETNIESLLHVRTHLHSVLPLSPSIFPLPYLLSSISPSYSLPSLPSPSLSFLLPPLSPLSSLSLSYSLPSLPSLLSLFPTLSPLSSLFSLSFLLSPLSPLSSLSPSYSLPSLLSLLSLSFLLPPLSPLSSISPSYSHPSPSPLPLSSPAVPEEPQRRRSPLLRTSQLEHSSTRRDSAQALYCLHGRRSRGAR